MIYVKKIQKTDPEARMVSEWLAQDSAHQMLGIKPEDIFEDGTETALVSDDNGPVIAIRFHRTLRVAMQFKPESRLRVARIGAEVVDWIKQVAKAGGEKEVIIRPGGKAVKFSKRLGFKQFIGRFVGV